MRLSNLSYRTPIRQLGCTRLSNNLNPETEAESEGQPEAESEGQPEAESEAKSEGQPEAKSEVNLRLNLRIY